jgi:hypothetical protein
MAKGEKPILSVRIDGDILKRVDALAQLAEVGRAEIVERCLTLGLANQETLVEWVDSPIKGAVGQLLTYPTIAKAILKFLGDEVDETSMKIRQGAVKKRRGKAKPALQ